MSGFATTGYELTCNSGGFNLLETYSQYGHKNHNGFRDNNKFMSEAEGSLLIGSWVAAVKADWPSKAITFKETMAALTDAPKEDMNGERVSIYRR
jgi:hypothetical protein